MLIDLTSRGRTASPDLLALLGECHTRIRHFSALAREVARLRDTPAAEVTRACAEVARYFREALPLHVADEEDSIEPRLRGRFLELDRSLDVMRADHGKHAGDIAQLLRALAEVGSAPLALDLRPRLASIAEPFGVDIEAHLAREERVIFPAIAQLLDPGQQASIIQELRGRRR